MPKQSYKMYTRNAVAGEVYGLDSNASQRQTFTNKGASVIPYGVAVKRHADGDRACALGGAAMLLGVAMRQLAHEVPARAAYFNKDFDNTSGYAKEQELAVTEMGMVTVEVAAVPANITDPVLVHPTTGKFSGTAAGGYSVTVLNAEWVVSDLETAKTSTKHIAAINIVRAKIAA